MTCFVMPAVLAAAPGWDGADQADNAPYFADPTITAGDNGGTGWQAWAVQLGGGDDLVSDSASTVGGNSSVLDTNGRTFILSKNGNTTVYRRHPNATFSTGGAFMMTAEAINSTSTITIGFEDSSNNSLNRFTFNTDDTITVIDATGSTLLSNVSAAHPVRVVYQPISLSQYNITFTELGTGSQTETLNNRTFFNTTNPVARFLFTVVGTGDYPLFNDMRYDTDEGLPVSVSAFQTE